MSQPASLSVDEQLQLITRNLQEVMGADVAVGKLRNIITERPLKVYWGTATTGAPHIAYFVPMSKLADFLRAGCEVTILFADLHAYLDNMKAPWELLKHRTDYYEAIIKEMLKAIGVSIEKLRFVRGTEYQLSREYSLDMYKLTTITTERNAKKAGAEVVKQVDSPCLSGMLYPLLQALDEEYLKVDAQFGGVDQRKIFTLAERCLPALGYTKRVHLMNPMVPGLAGAKMSSSEKGSKIDLLDSPESIATKIKDAFCPQGEVENNGVLAFVKMVLFAVQGDGFTIRREEKFGGDKFFTTYQELEDAYAAKEIFPLDLKHSVTYALNQLLEPIRTAFSTPEMQALVERAYPKETEGAAGNEADSVILDDDEEVAAVTSGVAAASVSKPAAAASSKAAKGGKGAKPAAPIANPNAPVDIARLDLRVGRVLKCEMHPRADKLYLSSVDVGGAEPLQVVSGLKEHVPLEQMQQRLVVLLTNLKPTSLVGVKSFAMILAASSADNSKVELLEPPAGAKVGERVSFDGFAVDPAFADTDLPRANDKVLKAVMADLRTDAEGVAKYKEVPFNTSAGVVRVQSLHGATIA